ncbi:hypothetical protein JCM3775_003722 [Rhodotorula graminis]
MQLLSILLILVGGASLAATAPTCGPSTFVGTDAHVCIPIDGWCLSAGQCFYSKRLPAGTYCPNRVLQLCPGGSGVTKCDSAGATVACNSGDGYHLQSSSKSCVLCHGYELWDAASEKCVCASGTYATDIVGCAQCTDFGALVKTCTEAGPLTCTDGNVLYDGRCFASCPAATFADSPSTCKACDSGVAACSGAGPGSATACGTDSSGTQLYLYQGNCVTSNQCPTGANYVPPGTFADATSGTCVACAERFGEGAYTCTSQGATGCINAIAHEGRCLASCPGGTYQEGQHCNSCSTLSSGSPCSLDMATSCNYLLDEATSTCTSSCRLNPSGSLPATYRSGSACKSCGPLNVYACDEGGPYQCLGPSTYLPRARRPHKCITVDQCLALGQDRFIQRYGPGKILFECTTCNAGMVPTSDKYRCVYGP